MPADPAAAPEGTATATLVHDFTIGTLRCKALSDGFVAVPAALLASEVPIEELQALLRENGLDAERHYNPISCLYVDLPDGRSVIVDTGMGDAPGFDGAPNTTAGRFGEALAQAGIDPAAIDVVLVSHIHPDHIGGAFDDAEKPLFPNAHYYVSRQEEEFWRDPANGLDGTLMPPPKKVQTIAIARRFLDRAADRLTSFEAGDRLLGQIDTVLLPGHTAGQVGFLFDGGTEKLLYTADAAGHPIVSLQRPEWRFAFDADSPLAVATRKSLIGDLLDRGLYNFTPHFPWPSFGRVAQKDGKVIWAAGH